MGFDNKPESKTSRGSNLGYKAPVHSRTIENGQISQGGLDRNPSFGNRGQGGFQRKYGTGTLNDKSVLKNSAQGVVGSGSTIKDMIEKNSKVNIVYGVGQTQTGKGPTKTSNQAFYKWIQPVQ